MMGLANFRSPILNNTLIPATPVSFNKTQSFKSISLIRKITKILNQINIDNASGTFRSQVKFNMSLSLKYLKNLSEEEGLAIINQFWKTRENVIFQFDLLSPDRELLLDNDILLEKDQKNLVRQLYRVYKGLPNISFTQLSLEVISKGKKFMNTKRSHQAERILLILLMQKAIKEKQPKYNSKQAIKKELQNLDAQLGYKKKYNIKISENGPFWYPNGATLVYPLPCNKSQLTHEYGHYVFEKIVLNLPKFDTFKSDLHRLFRLSKSTEHDVPLFNLVDDNNYDNSLETTSGHPQENLTEFFASSFNILNTAPKKYKANTLSFGKNSKLRTFGIQLWQLFKQNGLILINGR